MRRGRGHPKTRHIGRAAGRRGFALLLVLVVVAIATTLGMAFVAGAALKMDSSRNLVRAARARGLAESGLEHALYVLQSSPNALAAATKASPLGPYFIDANDDTYVLYCDPNVAGSGGNYAVVGEANCGGSLQRASLIVNAMNKFDTKLIAMGPMHYWRLGETSGTTANDQTGGNGWYMNGVLLGQTGVLTGTTNACARFDGASRYVNVGTFDINGNDCTMLAWFKADDSDMDARQVIAKSTGSAEASHYWSLGVTVISGHARLHMRLRTGNEITTLVAGSGDVTPGTWVFAVAVYDGADMILYKDGVEVGRMPKNSGIRSSNSAQVWIGGTPPTATNRPWKGCIDEVAVFSRNLSAAEIGQLYNARAPVLKVLSWND